MEPINEEGQNTKAFAISKESKETADSPDLKKPGLPKGAMMKATSALVQPIKEKI